MTSWVQCCVLISAFLFSRTEQSENAQDILSPQGTDCTEIQIRSPESCSGVYVILPPKFKIPIKVYCEMRPDGGWTVFQRRSGPALSFEKKWKAYQMGFGDLTMDHWLGLRTVSSLTGDSTKKWTLRVDLWDHDNGSAFAEYKDFSVGEEKDAYKLNVGQFSGDAGDAIRGAYPGIDQNGFGFSTVDRDNDGCTPCLFGDILQRDCASSEGGGWWYSRCGSASLNGVWHPRGQHIGWASGVHWLTWKGPAPYSMKGSRMMIKTA